MATVNQRKRSSTVQDDRLKLLVCKKCNKDDKIILSLKTCGCLICDSCDGESRDKYISCQSEVDPEFCDAYDVLSLESCDSRDGDSRNGDSRNGDSRNGDSRDICISCNSAVDPNIRLSFTKNARCKFYQLNKCDSNAEYECKCISDGFVCSSCLAFIHARSKDKPCSPKFLYPEIIPNVDSCRNCGNFPAMFVSQKSSEKFDCGDKICFDCKTKHPVDCTPLDSNYDKYWIQFQDKYKESLQDVSNQIKKIENELDSSRSNQEKLFEQEETKCESAISEIRKSCRDYGRYLEELFEIYKSKLADSKKDADNLRLDGIIKTILDLLKDQQLNLYGNRKIRKEQIFKLLKYYQEKNSYSFIAEQIQTFIVRNKSRGQHLLRFPLPSSSMPSVSDVSVQEVIDNGVKPFFILVVKQKDIDGRNWKLKNIKKREDEWKSLEGRFSVNENVIIFDADTTDMFKCKRAKVLRKDSDYSKVSLLDFGFEISVKNSSVGKIDGFYIDGKKTCFLAQVLTGSVDVNCDLTGWIAKISDTSQGQQGYKAQHLRVID